MAANDFYRRINSIDIHGMNAAPWSGRSRRDSMWVAEYNRYGNSIVIPRKLHNGLHAEGLYTHGRIHSVSPLDVDMEDRLPRDIDVRDNPIREVIDGYDIRKMRRLWTTAMLLLDNLRPFAYYYGDFDDRYSEDALEIRASTRNMPASVTAAAWSLVEVLNYIYGENPSALSSHGIIGTLSELTMNIHNECMRFCSALYDDYYADRRREYEVRVLDFVMKIVTCIITPRAITDVRYSLVNSHYRYGLLARCMLEEGYLARNHAHEYARENGAFGMLEEIGLTEDMFDDVRQYVPYTLEEMQQEAREYEDIEVVYEVMTRTYPKYTHIAVAHGLRDTDPLPEHMFYNINETILGIVANPARRYPYDAPLQAFVDSMFAAMARGDRKSVVNAMMVMRSENSIWVGALLHTLLRTNEFVAVDTGSLVLTLCWIISKERTIMELVRYLETFRETYPTRSPFLYADGIASHPLFVHTLYATVRAWAELGKNALEGVQLHILTRFIPEAWCLAVFAHKYATNFPVVRNESAWYSVLSRMTWCVAAAGLDFEESDNGRPTMDLAAANALVDATEQLFYYKTMRNVIHQGRIAAVVWIMSTRLAHRLVDYGDDVLDTVAATFGNAGLRAVMQAAQATLSGHAQ